MTLLETLFNGPLLLTITIFSFVLKGYLLSNLVMRNLHSGASKRPFFFLVFVLISAMAIDFSWILSLIRTLWLPTWDYRFYLFFIRLAWAFYIIQYQSYALFMENLVDQGPIRIRHKIFIAISSAFIIFDVAIALINFNCYQTADRPDIEFFIRNLQNVYMLLILMIPSIAITIWKVRTADLPLLLRKQMKVLIPAFIIPTWVSDIWQTYPLVFDRYWATNSYTAVIISLLITLASFYCARKVATLRFLNLETHVQSPTKFNFVDGFKTILEQLSHATTIAELGYITQTFFNKAFGIPAIKTVLCIRKKHTTELSDPVPAFSLEIAVENFFNNCNPVFHEHLKSLKILIHDEVAFSKFYENDEKYALALQFLETINADIFVPIYEKQQLIAYIIVQRYAQPDKFYGDVEQDEMIVFAGYLSNLINLMQNRNLDMIIHQVKELKEELYNKHQEINQYKESVRSFLKSNKQKEIGIIFYKNRKFVFGNKAAKEMIPININVHNGHPITKELKYVAQQVEDYNLPHSRFTQDSNGTKLVLAGVPSLDRNNVIITVYHPEISDVIKKQIDLLNDPTQWDFLLYLETTESGKLINQLVPGSGETFLNFKISLLKAALSKKAILLEMPDEDLDSIVQILHHISLRETLHTLKLHYNANGDTAVKLFGANTLLGTPKNKPLLEQLNDTGTLFIQNIHFLDIDTQEYLAEFIRYGLYRPYKSNQKIPANVRIICSTNQNLQTRVHEGTFSKALFNELKAVSLTMPSLLSLPEQELSTLADGFIEQALQSQSHDFKNLLDLSEKEHARLAHMRPVSLQELRSRIHNILIKKSKDNQIEHETHFDPAYQVTDPQLVEAARLGKHALRDPRLMAMLWNKFKSQSKIAEFLDVNRSSVNRRCKEFNLE